MRSTADNSAAAWFLALVAAVSSILSACDPAIGPLPEELAPRKGLTLVLSNYLIDGGGRRIPSYPATSFMVAGDTLTFQRVSGSMRTDRYDSLMTRQPVSTFLHISRAGDLELFERLRDSRESLLDDRWITFPIGLKGTKENVVDTAFVKNNIRVHYRERIARSFLGPETFVAKVRPNATAGPLSVLVAEVKQTVDSTIGVYVDFPNSITRTVWYSPKLGMIVKYEEVARSRDSTYSGWGYETMSYEQR